MNGLLIVINDVLTSFGVFLNKVLGQRRSPMVRGFSS